MSQRAKRDLTTGSIPKLIMTLSLPAMLDMAMGAIAMLMHAYWMGRVGGTALASVAMGTTLRLVLISPMMGLSAGGAAVVARHIGAKESRQADNAVMQSVLLVFLFVTPIALLGQAFAPTFLRWMGAEGEVATGALAYLRIILGGLFFMECLPTMNTVIRAAGHPEYTLRINLVNVIVLSIIEPIVVLGLGPIPAMGVRGAAIANVISVASAVLAQFITMRGGQAGVKLHRADLRPDGGTMRRIVKVALPASVQRFSPNFSNALLMRLVAAQGDVVLTAYSLLSRLGTLLQAAANGAGSAATAMMGQNLGANKPERSERSTNLTTIGAAVVTAICFGVVNVFPEPILGFFGQHGDALETSIRVLRLYSVYAVVYSVLNVLSLALVGAGDTISALVVNVGSMWLVLLPLAWYLSMKTPMGATGIWVAMIVGNLVGAVAIYRQFRAGRWRRVKV